MCLVNGYPHGDSCFFCLLEIAMFGPFKTRYVKQVEQASIACAEIYKSTSQAFYGPNELLALTDIPKHFYRAMRDSQTQPAKDCFHSLKRCEQQIAKDLKSGVMFGLMNVVLTIIYVEVGFEESPSRTANRIIQELYKQDISRFVIEGKQYSPDELDDWNLPATPENLF